MEVDIYLFIYTLFILRINPNKLYEYWQATVFDESWLAHLLLNASYENVQDCACCYSLVSFCNRYPNRQRRDCPSIFEVSPGSEVEPPEPKFIHLKGLDSIDDYTYRDILPMDVPTPLRCPFKCLDNPGYI